MHNGFINFINTSKTPYHAVENIKKMLVEQGFSELYENSDWSLERGGKYFVVRNGSSLIAFKNNCGGFVIAASHSDSPAFCVKSDNKGGAYVKLATEKYGGSIHYTWLDRPLGIAGRAMIRTECGIKSVLVDLGKSVVIPSVAIHLNRAVNENCALNPARDLVPLAALSSSGAALMDRLAEACGCDKSDIISHDLLLYCKQEAMLAGLSDELVCAPRIDDLAAVYTSALAFIEDGADESCPVLAVFDNEEVGSSTKQGAASAFLSDTLLRIAGDRVELVKRLANGFMASIDNAHALHPNHPELYDGANAPVLGGGVVIKHNANQRYTTDAVSDAIFKTVCHKAGVPYSSYYNRPDMPGGSTLGSISNTVVPIKTVDIGLPQLAMHSSYETAAVADIEYMYKAVKQLYSSVITEERGDIKIK